MTTPSSLRRFGSVVQSAGENGAKPDLKVGYVPQHNTLLHTLTVSENAYFTAQLTAPGQLEAERIARVERLGFRCSWLSRGPGSAINSS